ncbi:uncharacterized, partial [Tachysurus ichikawai]
NLTPPVEDSRVVIAANASWLEEPEAKRSFVGFSASARRPETRLPNRNYAVM